MQLTLARTARRKPGRPPKWLFPDAAVRSYLRWVNGFMAKFRNQLNDRLVSRLNEFLADSTAVKADGGADSVEQVIADLQLWADEELKGSENIALTLAQEVATFNLAQYKKVANSLFGIDPIGKEPWLEEEMKSFAKTNAKLIKSVPQKALWEIEERVMTGVRGGVSVKSLQKDIMSRYNVAKSRAQLIARDQVGKLNGQLTKSRQKDLGVDKYIWRTSLDRRVRGTPGGLNPTARHSHYAREGKVFSWDKPPPDGHPGEPIQCRCYAEPVIEGLD